VAVGKWKNLVLCGEKAALKCQRNPFEIFPLIYYLHKLYEQKGETKEGNLALHFVYVYVL
jgi:hypothetical protein